MSLSYKCISQSGAEYSVSNKKSPSHLFNNIFSDSDKGSFSSFPLSTFALISILFSPTRVNFRKSVSHFVSFAISIKKGEYGVINMPFLVILRLPRGQKFVKNIEEFNSSKVHSGEGRKMFIVYKDFLLGFFILESSLLHIFREDCNARISRRI